MTESRAPRQLGGKGGKPTTMTDAEVLEARALQMFAGWSSAQLQDRYPHVGARTLDAILQGINRARLVATRKHLPELAGIDSSRRCMLANPEGI